MAEGVTVVTVQKILKKLKNRGFYTLLWFIVNRFADKMFFQWRYVFLDKLYLKNNELHWNTANFVQRRELKILNA